MLKFFELIHTQIQGLIIKPLSTMKRSVFCTVLLMAILLVPRESQGQIKRLLKEKAIEALRENQQEETTTQT